MKQYCCENWEYCDESPEECPIAQRNKAYADFNNAKEALIALIFETVSEFVDGFIDAWEKLFKAVFKNGRG